MPNCTIKFYPTRNLIKPESQFQLTILTPLVDDDITTVTVNSIDPSTPASGHILVQDDLKEWHRLAYDSWSVNTFSINAVESDDDNDFAYANASLGNNVWVSDLDLYSLYELNVTLSSFNRSANDRVVEKSSLAGNYIASELNSKDIYSCTISYAGFPDNPTVEEVDMLFSSVLRREEFTVTNIDESDREMTVTLSSGRPQRERMSSNYIDRFNYQFSIEEIL